MNKVFGTEIYGIVLIISIVEILICFYQFIHYLERPSDKERRSYLILVSLLISYNLSCGFFPDPNIPIPIVIQVIIAFICGIATSIYFTYYLYKVYELHQIRKFFIKGAIYGLILPFVLTIVIVYSFTLDLNFSRKLFVFIPALYGLAVIYQITKTFSQRVRKSEMTKLDAFSGLLAIACWIVLPYILYFGDHQVIQHSISNFGFIVLTISYIRKSIFRSQKEYEKLKESEGSLKEKVREQTIHLERLIDQKNNTIINLTHELKTPLTLLQNYLISFEAKFGSSPELDNIKKSQNKITRDIINLFNIEKMSREDDLETEDICCVNFSELLQYMSDFFYSYAQKKGIAVSFDIKSNLRVDTISNALPHIINNLIENAIKYSEHGGKIDIRLYEENDMVYFTVSDNGIGIPISLQRQIFEPYFQIGTKKRNRDGMGLGLSIVKKFVEKSNGVITVESMVNTRTTFTVSLPLSSGENTREDEMAEPEIYPYINTDSFTLEDSIGTPYKPYIMLIEDNEELLSMMYQSMKGRFNIYTATSGNIAIEKLQKGIRVDLFISDIMMDGMDGFELYELISEHPSYQHIPFIFLTAKTDNHSRLTGLTAGAISYLDKPVEMKVLIKKADSILLAFKKQRHALIDQTYINHQVASSNAQGFPVAISTDDFEQISSKYNLTNQETKICKMMVQGLQLSEISNQLNISKNTLKSHNSNIYDKLEVRSKAEVSKLIKKELNGGITA